MTALASTMNSGDAAFDAALVLRFNSGDVSAFDEIVDRYRSKIFSIALGMIRNRSDAEEITQDTFVRAYRGLNRFRGEASLATWLHRIAVNLARNRYWYFFRRRRHASLSLDAPVGAEGDATVADLISDERQDPAQENVCDEFAQTVAECMERLDPAYRRILTMRNVQNLPYEEIANTLRINVGTVKSRIARAREHLRKELAAFYPDLGHAASGEACFLAGPRGGTIRPGFSSR